MLSDRNSSFLKTKPIGSLSSDNSNINFIQPIIYGSNLSSHTSRVPYSSFGRMKSSPSLDRINLSERSNVIRHTSFLDLNRINDTPLTASSRTRNASLNMMRNTSWKNSSPDSSSFDDLSRSRPRSRINGHSSFNEKLLSQTPESSIMSRRNQLIGSLNTSPTFNHRHLTSNLIKPWNHYSSSKSYDLYRPRLRERPLLSNLSGVIRTKLESKPKKSSLTSSPSESARSSITEKWRSHGGINRYRTIKFREHHIGQTRSQRRSSITWDLPEEISSSQVEAEKICEIDNKKDQEEEMALLDQSEQIESDKVLNEATKLLLQKQTSTLAAANIIADQIIKQIVDVKNLIPEVIVSVQDFSNEKEAQEIRLKKSDKENDELPKKRKAKKKEGNKGKFYLFISTLTLIIDY